MNGGRLSIALCAAVSLGAITAAPAGAIGFLDEWGGAGSGRLSYPVSVATGSEGSVYVADSEYNRIKKFTIWGSYLTDWGGPGTAISQFSTPESVATDVTGNVYVIDKGNFRVQKFDSGGFFLGQWGRQGAGPGQFQTPEGIAVDGSGNVYVADAGNNRIEKFSSAGAFLEQWGTAGNGPGQLAAPADVAVDAAGNVYVADSENGRIEKFTGSGAFIGLWGAGGGVPRRLELPIAVAVDRSKVFVADAGENRVVEFTTSGAFVRQWGSPGSAPGQFSLPVGIEADGGRVYVADAGNDRIEVFGPVPAPTYGKTVNLARVAGVVRLLVPGSRRHLVLGAGLEVPIPVGAIVDTTRGRVRLVSAKNTGGGSQSADFFDGTFKVLQPRGGRPITVLKLENPVRCGKAGHPRATASRSRSNGLWGSGKGNFRSEGRHGSATVRGTIWWAQDRCDGTKFKVKRGIVTVRDFTNHRTLKLRRGETYLAPVA